MAAGLSRRNFLRTTLLSLGALGPIFYGEEALGSLKGGFESADAWRAASLDNDSFLLENQTIFNRIALGCSFEPEEWTREEKASGDALRALDFCVRDLGLRELRLGIRWDRVTPNGGAIDLGAYRPYLDYCFEAGVNVCLNIGPLRTFRWPEDRVPRAVLASLPQAIPPGTTIDWDSPLASVSLSYVGSLITQLRREYGKEIEQLSAVQPENESFQGFDREGWRVSQRYMTNLILEIDSMLPNVPILVTSAGRPALAAITNLFADLLGRSDRFRGRLISGFDYYYSTPNHDRIPLHSYLDPIALAFHFPSAKTCEANLRDSRTVGFRVEVSEAQAEPFANITAPGNSARDFRFMLLRCASKVLDPDQNSVLRIWGVEKMSKRIFANQGTSEHQAICDLIRRLTHAAPSHPTP